MKKKMNPGRKQATQEIQIHESRVEAPARKKQTLGWDLKGTGNLVR